VTEVPRPEPIPTEVLVRVHAAGVNPVDSKTRAGGGFLGTPPFTVGWDVAGAVEEVGGGCRASRLVIACSGPGGGAPDRSRRSP
jgi:NADPH:quinone reductase-like Zn-dependent oxidoreductase